MKTLIIGDIHGNYLALQQVFHRSKFDPLVDRLITIGDYSDGYPDSFEVIQALSNIKVACNNGCVFLQGNHDEWLFELLQDDRAFKCLCAGDMDYIKSSYDHMWNQGGRNTALSYAHAFQTNGQSPEHLRETHLEFLSNLTPYHTENNIAFVHGGFDLRHCNNLQAQYSIDKAELWWDRTLWERACHLQHLVSKGYPVREDTLHLGGYDKIFIGHTSTDYDFPDIYPVKCANVINVDSGAGGRGVLTGYVLETDEIFISNCSTLLYPGAIPRG